MARNEFEREVGDLLKGLFPIAERLDDAAFNREGLRQVRQKPWDYYGATYSGRFWAAEVKRVKSTRFPLVNFKPHQHESMIRLIHYGLLAWVFINWRLGGSRGTGTAIWIPYLLFDVTSRGVQEKGRKSLKSDDFENFWQLERCSGGWSVPNCHPFNRQHLEILGPWKSYTTLTIPTSPLPLSTPTTGRMPEKANVGSTSG